MFRISTKDKLFGIVCTLVFLLGTCGVFLLTGNTSTFVSATNGDLPSYYNLRDDYIIYTEDQTGFNNCWGFGMYKSLETCLAINTGQYYDFSEAYLTLAEKCEHPETNFVLGATGNNFYTAYYTYSMKYGVVLETDFPYDELTYINSDNYQQYYDYYKQFADYDIINSVSYVQYSYSTQRDEIKSHIMTNGAVNLYAYGMGYATNPADQTSYAYQASSGETMGHAVSIIGWDDNYTLTVNNNTYQGAWLILNSYNNSRYSDGIFYFLYDYYQPFNYLFAFEYTGNEVDIQLDSTAEYYTNVNHKYSKTYNYTATNKLVSNNNIFEYQQDGTDIYLRYTISDYANYQDVDVDIFQNSILCEDFNITYANGVCEITSIDGTVPLGTYKVRFLLDDNTINREFAVLSKLEFNYISYAPERANGSTNPMYVNFATHNNAPVIDVYFSSTYGSFNYINLVDTPYLDIASYTISNDCSFNQNTSSGQYNIRFYETTDGDYVYYLKLTNSAGQSITYTINYHLRTGWLVNVKYSIGDAIQDNGRFVFLDNDNRVYLESPYANGKIFNGFTYSDTDGVEHNLGYDTSQGKYYITIDDVQIGLSNNYFTQNYPLETYHFYLILSANFIDVQFTPILAGIDNVPGVEFEFGEALSLSLRDSNVTAIDTRWYADGEPFDGDSILDAGTHEILCQIDYRSGDRILTAEYSQNIDIAPKAITVTLAQTTLMYNGNTQNPEVIFTGALPNDDVEYSADFSQTKDVGTYNVTITVSDKNYTTPVTELYYQITPRDLTIVVDDKTSVIGEAMEQLSYHIEGEYYDDLDISLSCELGETAGDYDIVATYTPNNNYNISVQNGKYTLTDAEVISPTTGNTDTGTILIICGVVLGVLILSLIIIRIVRNKGNKLESI